MLTAKLILDRLDKEGRLLERREQQALSFTKGFIQLLYVASAQILYAAPYSITNIAGTPIDVHIEGGSTSRYTTPHLRIASSPGTGGILCYQSRLSSMPNTQYQTIKGENIGIQVGTGTTAVTPTDTAMETRIVHGTAASTFQYGGCELIDILFSGLSPHDGEFTIRRYFTNASGGSITVNEAGIYTVGTYGSAATAASYSFMIAHDIVSPGVAVADTEVLRVTYVPQITV